MTYGPLPFGVVSSDLGFAVPLGQMSAAPPASDSASPSGCGSATVKVPAPSSAETVGTPPHERVTVGDEKSRSNELLIADGVSRAPSAHVTSFLMVKVIAV